MGGGVCPPPVLPWCTGRADTRSAPSWKFPPGHYTPQLGNASALPLSSFKSWVCRPRLLHHPPVQDPPFPQRDGFGSAQTATPLPSPSHTKGSQPAPLVSPFSSFPPSACPYPSRPECMADHPHNFADICLQPHPVNEYCNCVKDGLESPRANVGYHTVICVENSFPYIYPFLRALSFIIARTERPSCRMFCCGLY